MAAQDNVRLIDESRDFQLRDLFFSTTDLHGVIRHGNELFARISDYELHELVGRPHSVVRHPDMPRAVFKLFWEMISAGKSIAAYVKNLARDGRYYWVLAVAMPSEDGYISVRLKPTSRLFPKMIELYAQLREIERGIESEPKQRVAAMEASTAELNRQLHVLGFGSYDDFMVEALTQELDSRQRGLDASEEQQSKYRASNASPAIQGVYESCESIDRELQQFYARMVEFRTVQNQLTSESRRILKSADTIRSLSVNAMISAHRLGSRAATLNLVAESLGTVANDNQLIIRNLSTQMDAVATTMNRLMFDVSATKLQSEVCLQFLEEVCTGNANAGGNVEGSLRTLFQQMFKRITLMFESLRRTEARLIELRMELDSLNRNNQKLYFVQFTGHKEATGIDEANGFAVVFDEVREHIETTREDCKSLTNSVYGVMHEIRSATTSEESLLHHLQPLTAFRSLSNSQAQDVPEWGDNWSTADPKQLLTTAAI